MDILKIVIVVVLLVMADFVLWQKWREEFSDDEIFVFSLVVGLAAAGGGILAAMVQHASLHPIGIAGWGALTAGFGAGVLRAKRNHWDVWETMDTMAGILAWLWTLTSWFDGYMQTAAAIAGLLLVAVFRRGYRKWRWYKSGKIGLVGLGFLGWFACSQIVFAFMTPGGIYWWGLEASQWVCAYILAFVIVTIYLRSGRRLKDELGWLRTRNHGQKENIREPENR